MPAGTMDLYRELLDSLGAVTWESDPDPRRFVGLDTIHAEDRSRVRAACAHAIQRCTEDRIEYRVLTPDGRTLHRAVISQSVSKNRIWYL